MPSPTGTPFRARQHPARQTYHVGIRDELADPWGWMLGAISGGVGWAVLLGPLPAAAAALAGLGIGAAVLGAKTVIGATASRTDSPREGAARDRLPEPPRNSQQYELLARARRAVANTRDLAERPSDEWLRGEAQSVAIQAENALTALADLAGRITLLDNTIAAADPQAVARETAAVQEQVRRARDQEVRADQQRALDALDAQADSIGRLLSRRDSLLAQLRTTAVNLEGLAARAGELVALGPGSMRSEAAGEIVTDLTSSLETVRAGIEEARKVLREL